MERNNNGESGMQSDGKSRSGAELTFVTHEFAPVFDAHSRVLLLGSIPSPKSRETHFYYGHPRNRFWKTLSAVFDAPVPETIPEKKTFLLAHGIALWDVLQSCLIHGADDGSITEPVPNDIAGLLRQTDVHCVFTTGSKAYALYMKYCYPKTQTPAVKLPSTSPANCRMRDEELKEAYRAVRKALDEIESGDHRIARSFKANKEMRRK